MPGWTTSCGDPRLAVASSHDGFPPAPYADPNPSACSSAHGLPVKPAAASSVASDPQRAAWPTCQGLQSVPKFALSPLAIDAAIARAWTIRSAGRPRSLAVAAAAPNTPRADVACQPTSYSPGFAARPSFASTSTPATKAVRSAVPGARSGSATARAAGSTGTDGCPESDVLRSS